MGAKWLSHPFIRILLQSSSRYTQNDYLIYLSIYCSIQALTQFSRWRISWHTIGNWTSIHLWLGLFWSFYLSIACSNRALSMLTRVISPSSVGQYLLSLWQWDFDDFDANSDQTPLSPKYWVWGTIIYLLLLHCSNQALDACKVIISSNFLYIAPIKL